MAYRTIGSVVVEWDDNEPFIFTLAEGNRPDGVPRAPPVTFDLSDLRGGFEDTFLMHFKEALMDDTHKVVLTTIKIKGDKLIRFFKTVINLALFDTKVGLIDETFLLCLSSVENDLDPFLLTELRQLFKSNPYAPLFAPNLHVDDFPEVKFKKGLHGRRIDSILAKALSRAAVVNSLDLVDTAYAAGVIDIGHHSFAHLAFAVFCRPNSYRQIRVSDLIYDKTANRYSIRIVRSKSGERNPGRVNFFINEPLGVLLTKQRQNVIDTYSHLIAKEDIEKLVLFPARSLVDNNSRWRHDYANENFGMCIDSDVFVLAYPEGLKRRLKAKSFSLSAVALRHTVGTLLAQTGASAKTISAVLKHASSSACRPYVDIAFHGMVDDLSEAMHPAFDKYLPGLLNFRTRGEPCSVEKIVRSEDLETGQIEEIGECGNYIACQDAPIVCYGCPRFRPCWDADHSINFKIIQREIDDMSKRGKAFEHMVERAHIAKNQILFTMNAADRYRDAISQKN